ncbi:MAG: hypothetical protein OEW21_08765 [Betaproteobacteria bacterium]|nr:hypothetical protein [Betaproteobacteria bacterium]
MTQPDIERIDPERAIERLLVAEEDALAIVERNEADTELEIGRARARARAISERAAARIAAASERYLARHAQRLTGLAEALRCLATDEAEADARRSRLGEIAERFAQHLTTEGDDG